MKEFLSIITLATVLLFTMSAMAADRVVVIPLGSKGSVSLNQHCPGESPVVGIDANGHIICGIKIVFISSNTYQGDLVTLTGADDKCNTLAAAAGLSGVYKAWLSDNFFSPSNRFAKSNWSYILTNGTVIANGWDDLTDGVLLAEINVNQRGETYLTNTSVWTATAADGSFYGSSCASWNSGTAGWKGVRGNGNSKGKTWTQPISTVGDLCSYYSRLYCFEQ